MPEPIENDQTPASRPQEACAEHEAFTRPEVRGGGNRARLTQLALVGLMVALVVTVIAITTKSSTATAPSSGPRAGETHQVESLLADIPQRSNVLGQAKALITLRWFGDLECPYCKEFALGALPSIVRQWVRSGRLKIEYFSMETATREPKIFKLQEVAALAAGIQNKMWNFIDAFYHDQGEEGSGYVTEKYLQGIADQVPGLNRSLWAEDRHDPTLTARIAAEMRVADEARFTGTPSFLISRRGGRVIKLSPPSLTNPKAFDIAIEYLLDGGKRPQQAVPA